MDPISLLLVAVLGAFIFLQFSRVRRQQKQVRETQQGVQVGNEVLTAAGLVATVVEVTETVVTLQGVDGTRSRWVKGAVVRILSTDDPLSATPKDPAFDTEDDGTPRTTD